MEAFSRRNFGWHGTLEVDDPEIGAQAQEFDYPLTGAAFDIHDQHVQLGRDLAIRIAHGNGQTLLTFAA